MVLGDGRVCVGVHEAVRLAAGVEPGDHVLFELRRDDEPRQLDVPEALLQALAAEPAAREGFDRLSWTHRREHAERIASARQESTRQSRVSRTIAALLGRAAP